MPGIPERSMSKVKVLAFGVSIDGFGAGPEQSLENPLGVGGPGLHQWFFPTRTFQRMHAGGGADAGTTGPDDDFARESFVDIGAWILGRNMFGPVRGPWLDDAWKGWWGEEPPYHMPVFVLTHHARAPLVMAGGTTFHFVTGGIHEALDRAREGAKGKHVRIGGGPATVRQYLQAGLIDEMHLAMSPVLLGRGEAPFQGIDLVQAGFRVSRRVATELATHVTLVRSAG
jgi:dihydrofolate reductase